MKPCGECLMLEPHRGMGTEGPVWAWLMETPFAWAPSNRKHRGDERPPWGRVYEESNKGLSRSEGEVKGAGQSGAWRDTMNRPLPPGCCPLSSSQPLLS